MSSRKCEPLAALTRTCYSLSARLLASIPRLGACLANPHRRWSAVMRLIIAVIAGLVIAVAAVAIAENVLSSAANGTPSDYSLYVYGTR